MRRLLALAIAMLLGLPTVLPLFALSGHGEPDRPACCRRDGKHHCMLVDMEGAISSTAPGTPRATSPRLTDRCPYGAPMVAGSTHPHWTLRTVSTGFAGIVAQPNVAPQTESKRQLSSDNSLRKRGPPSALIA